MSEKPAWPPVVGRKYRGGKGRSWFTRRVVALEQRVLDRNEPEYWYVWWTPATTKREYKSTGTAWMNWVREEIADA